MDAVEVRVRGRRLAEARLDDLLWRARESAWRRRWEPADAVILLHPPATGLPLGPLTAERAALVRKADAGEAQRIVERAEAHLAGRYQLLGYPEVTLAPGIDHDRDPFTTCRWPDRHGKLLNYRDAEYGDPKWIWELNRCQELPSLCLAWRLSGDDRFAAAARSRMLDWLERSRPGRGIAWSNGFEAGLRGISFALTLDALRGSELLTHEDARLVLRGLWQHGRFIVRDHSFGSSANNHLIGEAAGLAAISLLAPELRDAGRWRESALSWLAGEAERQILRDGTGAEQAFGYTLFDLDLFLLVAALLEAQGLPVPQQIRAALERGAHALEAQVQGDEPDPAYGDSDDGRAVMLDGARGRRDARGVVAGIAAFLGGEEARHDGGGPDTTALVLFEDAGVRRSEAAPPAVEAESVLLQDSGLVVLRRGGVRVLFDVGPLGYLAIAAHGHADALHVTMSESCDELVGDPGTGSYFGDPVRRRAFRGTGFHATVTVDGLDQAEQAGPFLWRRHYRARLRMCDLERGIVVGEHDGYTRLADPVDHSRALLALEDGSLLVVDRLDANGTHHYTQTWPLHPSLEARTVDDVVEALLGPEPRLRLYTASSPPGRLRLRRGETDPLAGWWSRRLETAEAAWTIAYEVECPGGASFATLLVVPSRDPVPDPRVTVEFDGQTTHVAFVHKGLARQFELDLRDAARPARTASSST